MSQGISEKKIVISHRYWVRKQSKISPVSPLRSWCFLMVPFASSALVRSIHLFFTVHCVKLKQITWFHQILYETRRCKLLHVTYFTASHMYYLHQNSLVLSNQSTPFRWLVTMTTKKVILVMPPLDPMGPLCLGFVKSAFSSILSSESSSHSAPGLVIFSTKSDIDVFHKLFQVRVSEEKNCFFVFEVIFFIAEKELCVMYPGPFAFSWG